MGHKTKEAKNAYNREWRKRRSDLDAKYKENQKARYHARKASDPEGHKTYIRNQSLKQRYGINASEYDAMVVAQQSRCAICGVVPRVLIVDHEHRSGKVRSLLCRKCNAGIGMLGDSSHLLESAADYIRSHRT